jgi:hypothetical protein
MHHSYLHYLRLRADRLRVTAPFAVQEKIVPGNKILVTVKDEALAHSSIVAQGAITVDSAAAAAVIAAESDHSGDMIGGATMWSVGLTVFISLT